MNHNNNITMEPTSGGFNQSGYGVVSPFSVTDDTPPLLHHMYGGGGSSTPTTADSFTYYADGDNLFPLQTRKRSRDSRSSYYHHHLLHQNATSSCVTANTTTAPFSFLGQDIDISSHINHQQQEIDRFVSLHVSPSLRNRSMAE